MKFVKQKREDDCTSACLESLLGVSTPMFFTQTWEKDLQAWLRERGKAFIALDVHSLTDVTDAINSGTWPQDTHYLISGLGPRGRQHMCIGFNDEIAWDPHPAGGGTSAPHRVLFILTRET